MPLTPGTRLGPYEIAAPLGAGGMGEVYKARDTRLERIVAVKVLPAHLADRTDVEKKLAGIDASHVFYAARYDHPVEGKTEDVETNTNMLKNLVCTVEAGGVLEHVHALHGSKWYGHQLGPVKLPLEEDKSGSDAIFHLLDGPERPSQQKISLFSQGFTEQWQKALRAAQEGK